MSMHSCCKLYTNTAFSGFGLTVKDEKDSWTVKSIKVNSAYTPDPDDSARNSIPLFLTEVNRFHPLVVSTTECDKMCVFKPLRPVRTDAENERYIKEKPYQIETFTALMDSMYTNDFVAHCLVEAAQIKKKAFSSSSSGSVRVKSVSKVYQAILQTTGRKSAVLYIDTQKPAEKRNNTSTPAPSTSTTGTTGTESVDVSRSMPPMGSVLINEDTMATTFSNRSSLSDGSSESIRNGCQTLHELCEQFLKRAPLIAIPTKKQLLPPPLHDGGNTSRLFAPHVASARSVAKVSSAESEASQRRHRAAAAFSSTTASSVSSRNSSAVSSYGCGLKSSGVGGSVSQINSSSSNSGGGRNATTAQPLFPQKKQIKEKMRSISALSSTGGGAAGAGAGNALRRMASQNQRGQRAVLALDSPAIDNVVQPKTSVLGRLGLDLGPVRTDIHSTPDDGGDDHHDLFRVSGSGSGSGNNRAPVDVTPSSTGTLFPNDTASERSGSGGGGYSTDGTFGESPADSVNTFNSAVGSVSRTYGSGGGSGGSRTSSVLSYKFETPEKVGGSFQRGRSNSINNNNATEGIAMRAINMDEECADDDDENEEEKGEVVKQDGQINCTPVAAATAAAVALDMSINDVDDAFLDEINAAQDVRLNTEDAKKHGALVLGASAVSGDDGLDLLPSSELRQGNNEIQQEVQERARGEIEDYDIHDRYVYPHSRSNSGNSVISGRSLRGANKSVSHSSVSSSSSTLSSAAAPTAEETAARTLTKDDVATPVATAVATAADDDEFDQLLMLSKPPLGSGGSNGGSGGRERALSSSSPALARKGLSGFMEGLSGGSQQRRTSPPQDSQISQFPRLSLNTGPSNTHAGATVESRYKPLPGMYMSPGDSKSIMPSSGSRAELSRRSNASSGGFSCSSSNGVGIAGQPAQKATNANGVFASIIKAPRLGQQQQLQQQQHVQDATTPASLQMRFNNWNDDDDGAATAVMESSEPSTATTSGSRAGVYVPKLADNDEYDDDNTQQTIVCYESDSDTADAARFKTADSQDTPAENYWTDSPAVKTITASASVALTAPVSHGIPSVARAGGTFVASEATAVAAAGGDSNTQSRSSFTAMEQMYQDDDVSYEMPREDPQTATAMDVDVTVDEAETVTKSNDKNKRSRAKKERVPVAPTRRSSRSAVAATAAKTDYDVEVEVEGVVEMDVAGEVSVDTVTASVPETVVEPSAAVSEENNAPIVAANVLAEVSAAAAQVPVEPAPVLPPVENEHLLPYKKHFLSLPAPIADILIKCVVFRAIHPLNCALELVSHLMTLTQGVAAEYLSVFEPSSSTSTTATVTTTNTSRKDGKFKSSGAKEQQTNQKKKKSHSKGVVIKSVKNSSAPIKTVDRDAIVCHIVKGLSKLLRTVRIGGQSDGAKAHCAVCVILFTFQTQYLTEVYDSLEAKANARLASNAGSTNMTMTTTDTASEAGSTIGGVSSTSAVTTKTPMDMLKLLKSFKEFGSSFENGLSRCALALGTWCLTVSDRDWIVEFTPLTSTANNGIGGGISGGGVMNDNRKLSRKRSVNKLSSIGGDDSSTERNHMQVLIDFLKTRYMKYTSLYDAIRESIRTRDVVQLLADSPVKMPTRNSPIKKSRKDSAVPVDITDVLFQETELSGGLAQSSNVSASELSNDSHSRGTDTIISQSNAPVPVESSRHGPPKGTAHSTTTATTAQTAKGAKASTAAVTASAATAVPPTGRPVNRILGAKRQSIIGHRVDMGQRKVVVVAADNSLLNPQQQLPQPASKPPISRASSTGSLFGSGAASGVDKSSLQSPPSKRSRNSTGSIGTRYANDDNLNSPSIVYETQFTPGFSRSSNSSGKGRRQCVEETPFEQQGRPQLRSENALFSSTWSAKSPLFKGSPSRYAMMSPVVSMTTTYGGEGDDGGGGLEFMGDMLCSPKFAAEFDAEADENVQADDALPLMSSPSADVDGQQSSAVSNRRKSPRKRSHSGVILPAGELPPSSSSSSSSSSVAVSVPPGEESVKAATNSVVFTDGAPVVPVVYSASVNPTAIGMSPPAGNGTATATVATAATVGRRTRSSSLVPITISTPSRGGSSSSGGSSSTTKRYRLSENNLLMCNQDSPDYAYQRGIWSGSQGGSRYSSPSPSVVGSQDGNGCTPAFSGVSTAPSDLAQAISDHHNHYHSGGNRGNSTGTFSLSQESMTSSSSASSDSSNSNGGNGGSGGDGGTADGTNITQKKRLRGIAETPFSPPVPSLAVVQSPSSEGRFTRHGGYISAASAVMPTTTTTSPSTEPTAAAAAVAIAGASTPCAVGQSPGAHSSTRSPVTRSNGSNSQGEYIRQQQPPAPRKPARSPPPEAQQSINNSSSSSMQVSEDAEIPIFSPSRITRSGSVGHSTASNSQLSTAGMPTALMKPPTGRRTFRK